MLAEHEYLVYNRIMVGLKLVSPISADPPDEFIIESWWD